MKTVNNIQFPFFATRDQARRTVKNLRSSGKVVSLKDNGKDLPRGKRWEVVITSSVSVSKVVKTSKAIKEVKYSNKGWDCRKSTTGIGGFNVYYDGQFIFNSDHKYQASAQAKQYAHTHKIEVVTLNF